LLEFYYIVFLTIRRICCIFLLLDSNSPSPPQNDFWYKKKIPLFLFVNNNATRFCYSRHYGSGTAELTLTLYSLPLN